jgi:tetratricopeptide (TPR) repeat protein
MLALLAPFRVQAQCHPAQPGQPKPSASDAPSSPATPQFYDEPRFTVAGVAGATNLGGHGSDTVVRTKEALARDTASLIKPAAPDLSTSSSGATEKSLREAVGRDSQSFDANHQLGKLLADNGKAAEALVYLKRASQLSPRDSDKAELHHLLAEVEEKLKHPLEAVREYQLAAEKNPSEPYLFDWGTELLAHGASEAAAEIFARGNRAFPYSVRMLVGLGVAWHARGSYDKAAECLCAASDLNPNDPTPYIFLGKMQNAGTVQSANVVERLARFVRIQPENALANYYYAIALWKTVQATVHPNTAAHVQALLEKAVHLDPKLGSAYLQRGVVYSEMGDLPNAISAYQQAVEASPELEEPHYRLAQLYRRTGEKAKAERELQLYEQLSIKAKEQAERDRHDIQQFVVSLRDPKPTSTQPEKP